MSCLLFFHEGRALAFKGEQQRVLWTTGDAAHGDWQLQFLHTSKRGLEDEEGPVTGGQDGPHVVPNRAGFGG